MTRCAECGYDWSAPVAQAVAIIAAFPADAARLLPGDTTPALRTRPELGTWSPLEYLAHTGDAIDWYADRVQRVLAEHRPVLEPFDWDAHTAGQRYHERRLADVLDGVERGCARLTAVLGEIAADDWRRAGVGSTGPPRTVADLVHRAAHEARHHLRDIRVGGGVPRPPQL